MKRKILFIIVLFIVFIIISIIDKDYQINKEFKNMFNISTDELEKNYGSEIEEIFRLYNNGEYDIPTVSYFSHSNVESVVDITINKYEDFDSSYGNLVDSKSAFLVFKFKRIPVLNLDILESITPGKEYFNLDKFTIH